MKKSIYLGALCGLVFLAGCDSMGVAPGDPNQELVDVDDRIDEGQVNSHVYGSFALQFTETVPGGGDPVWGVITSGTANFPGNPNNAGTCDNGMWINKNGKATSGSLDTPHPHCMGWVEGVGNEEVAITVVLEPISARYTTYGQGGQQIRVNNDEEEGRVRLTGNGNASTGEGTVVGYAIDASTLGTTNRRVGILTFALSQYTDADRSYFDEDCTIEDVEDAPRCLDLVINATYEPLAEGGVGEVTENVTGFLYWVYDPEGMNPFNYGD